MSTFGPFGPLNGANSIKSFQGLTDRISAGSFKPYDSVGSFSPVTGDSATELANFLFTSGILYRTNRFFATVFPPKITNNTLSALSDRNGLRFVCENASIPNQSLFTSDYKLNNLEKLWDELS